MKITLSWLREKNARSEAVDAFEKHFGPEADYQAVLKVKPENLLLGEWRGSDGER